MSFDPISNLQSHADLVCLLLWLCGSQLCIAHRATLPALGAAFPSAHCMWAQGPAPVSFQAMVLTAYIRPKSQGNLGMHGGPVPVSGHQ